MKKKHRAYNFRLRRIVSYLIASHPLPNLSVLAMVQPVCAINSPQQSQYRSSACCLAYRTCLTVHVTRGVGRSVSADHRTLQKLDCRWSECEDERDHLHLPTPAILSVDQSSWWKVNSAADKAE